MAYNVYFACDNCGNVGASWVNYNARLANTIKIAREHGWRVGKRGWICPDCKAKMKTSRKDGGQNGRQRAFG